jgi:glycosyltransferase involved in cell wall biosynthesis
MLIDIYANDGSPLGVIPEDIYGRGVGGAELALMCVAEELGRRGHNVRIYNNPRIHGRHGNVLYLGQEQMPQNSEVFILFRSPNHRVRTVKALKKVHWSTDQYTIGNFGEDIVPFVDQIVCISPRHVSHYKENYRPKETQIMYIDLGVNVDEYKLINVDRKVDRFLFCSVPHRGLAHALQLWSRVKYALPGADLVITSDYSLWGSSPDNSEFKMMATGLRDIIFLGAVPRRDLLRIQKESGVQMYPCIYDELFCISSAECQVAGAFPVTTSMGALKTTNFMGRQIPGHPGSSDFDSAFVQALVEATMITNEERQEMMDKAAARFSWKAVADRWEAEVLNVGVRV